MKIAREILVEQVMQMIQILRPRGHFSIIYHAFLPHCEMSGRQLIKVQVNCLSWIRIRRTFPR